jgi:hypothetical protein
MAMPSDERTQKNSSRISNLNRILLSLLHQLSQMLEAIVVDQGYQLDAPGQSRTRIATPCYRNGRDL